MAVGQEHAQTPVRPAPRPGALVLLLPLPARHPPKCRAGQYRRPQQTTTARHRRRLHPVVNASRAAPQRARRPPRRAAAGPTASAPPSVSWAGGGSPEPDVVAVDRGADRAQQRHAQRAAELLTGLQQ